VRERERAAAAYSDMSRWQCLLFGAPSRNMLLSWRRRPLGLRHWVNTQAARSLGSHLPCRFAPAGRRCEGGPDDETAVLSYSVEPPTIPADVAQLASNAEDGFDHPSVSASGALVLPSRCPSAARWPPAETEGDRAWSRASTRDPHRGVWPRLGCQTLQTVLLRNKSWVPQATPGGA
jgi:hypothetical protein